VEDISLKFSPLQLWLFQFYIWQDRVTDFCVLTNFKNVFINILYIAVISKYIIFCTSLRCS